MEWERRRVGDARVLSICQSVSFGVGHFFNDLTLTMWSTYFLLYLRYVLQVPAAVSGLILMAGFSSDAISTLVAAFNMDRSSLGSRLPCKWLRRHGKRKLIHLTGSIIVLFTFPLLFSNCWGCRQGEGHESTTVPVPGPPSTDFLIYLALIAMGYMSGWATVQVSHLSMIPELSPNSWERTQLSIIRSSFDVLTHIVVYAVACIILATGFTFSSNLPPGIGTSDSNKFTLMAVVITCIGFVSTAVFHIGTPEDGDCKIKSFHDDHSSREESSHLLQTTTEMKCSGIKWRDWLKRKQYYQVAVLLAMARVFGNFSMCILPLYLQEELGAPKILQATVPLVGNISGFVISLLVNSISRICSKKLITMMGAALGLAGCMWLGFESREGILGGGIYGTASLIGAGAVIMAAIALALTADLVGENTESGAFVYGTISASEKLTNGLLILAVQVLREFHESSPNYYSNVISYSLSLTIFIYVAVFLSLDKSGLQKSQSQADPGPPPGQLQVPDESFTENTKDSTRSYGSVSETGFPAKDKAAVVVAPS